MTNDFGKQIREKQEKSFAHRLWILQKAYENSLEGKETEVHEITEKYDVPVDEIISAYKLLEKQMLMTCYAFDTSGTPHGMDITGLALYQIENAPILYFNELEKDVKEITLLNDDIKLEIERLREETKLKKYEIWVNVTSSISKASKWFGILFGG